VVDDDGDTTIGVERCVPGFFLVVLEYVDVLPGVGFAVYCLWVIRGKAEYFLGNSCVTLDISILKYTS
jgi:hypothetical protein